MVNRKNIETAILLINFVFLMGSLAFKEKNTEYTPYSRFLLNSYMSVLLGLCLLSCVCKINFISSQIGILNSGKGKGIVLLLVGLVYITGNSKILFILSIFLFCSAVFLIAMDTFLPAEKLPEDTQTNTTNRTNTNVPSETSVSISENKETDPSNPYGIPDDF